MNGLLTKLNNLRFPFLSNGKSVMRLYRAIDDSLYPAGAEIAGETALSNYLQKAMQLISTQINCRITVCKSDDLKNDSNPGSTAIDPSLHKYADYIQNNRTRLYSTDVALHFPGNLKHGDGFITLRLGPASHYLVYISTNRRRELQYQMLFLALRRLLDQYNSQLQLQELKSRITQIENTLIEKDRELQIAEKSVKRKVYDLHNLVEASNEIYSILNFKQLINSALLTIIGQVGIQSAFVLMYDPHRRAYATNFQKGFKPKEIQDLKFRLDSPIVRYFSRNHVPVYLSRLEREKELTPYVKKLKALGIFIVAPIVFTERLQGIIATGEKLYGREFSQTDFELFHVLVNIITISIENSLHYEEVKNLSLTDGMTNLHNYRYFVIRLKEELNRAKRNKNKVSLLILDIDYFKNYNDTLGHQAGDEALREVGKVLKNTVRDEDIVSRYGGEEFCIILPGINKAGMTNLGERIRINVEANRFYKEKVQPGGQLTVSLGGATYPDDAPDSNDLVQRADEALYQAKNRGRNQLRIFSQSAVSTKKGKAKPKKKKAKGK